MPRRPPLERSPETAAPAQMRFLSFKFSRLRAFLRLFVWLGLFLRFYLVTAFDVLLRRDSVERRARRLRQAFERRGGSFAKLGIHLSMRVDFMPWEFSVELSRMLDRMAPFPVEAALAAIERCTGKPVPATFGRFDPEPIAASSVACLYQAQLHSGEAVIVKVRRPGAGASFMADLQAFDWLLRLAEFLTIFPPGFTHGMRGEFRKYLLEELDFVESARRQDSFRRAAEDCRKDFFGAPKVYLDLSGEEVVVEQFASGLWLWELLIAVERDDQTLLDRARAMNIVPALVAERLLWVNNWAREEQLFFHADPHPTNIILGPDSHLYYVNFSSTASISRSQRHAVQQNLDYLRQRDPLNMARVSLVLLEPLPPIDLSQLIQELESYNWQLVYALEADPCSLTWQERTSAAQWIGMMRLARKYRIVVDSRVLRLLRATLLTESAAARLDPQVDFEVQYREFVRFRSEQARRRVTDAVLDHLDGDSNERLIIRLDRIGHILTGLLFRTRRALALPSVNFNTLMSKWSFAFYILVRFIVQVVVVTGLAGLLAWAAAAVGGSDPPLTLSFLAGTVIASPVYVLVILTLIFINGRTVLFRLDDKDD